jgi:predicted TPR repeat methyltransferase
MHQRQTDPALTYDAFAPVYDRFTAQNNYELWLGSVLLPELQNYGLRLGRLLDVGCGTGRAFQPMIRRGWEVHGCDISKGMLQQAREKHPEIPLSCCDAAALPTHGCKFDLIFSLNDVVNYLTSDGDLERCFDGLARNLALGGIVCLDSLTLSSIRSCFVVGTSRQVDAWTWTGAAEAVDAGGIGECRVAGVGVETNYHRVRHWTHSEVTEAAETSALRVLAVRGQQEVDGRIVLAEPDPRTDERTIYIMGHDA